MKGPLVGQRWTSAAKQGAEKVDFVALDEKARG
jgi:hypothetical protein